jgi:hypothetical protein
LILFFTSKRSGLLFRAALLGQSREPVFLDLKVGKKEARFGHFLKKLDRKWRRRFLPEYKITNFY